MLRKKRLAVVGVTCPNIEDQNAQKILPVSNPPAPVLGQHFIDG